MNKNFIIFLFFLSANVFAEAFICDDTTNRYYGVYEPKSYTCNQGYFLPANTDGCRPCPTGYTCNGGTFSFNPNIYQGIEIIKVTATTMNNMCASNFPTKFVGVYKPDTVTLNFDDDNGNTSTITCTYDGLVNLPPTPTRPGYKFAGWKLEVNNE